MDGAAMAAVPGSVPGARAWDNAAVIRPVRARLVALRRGRIWTGDVGGDGLVIDATARRFVTASGAETFSGTVFWRVLLVTAARSPRFVTWGELIDFVWSEDPDGGPLEPRNVIHGLRVRFAPRLAHLGLEVVSWHGVGLACGMARGGAVPCRRSTAARCAAHGISS